MKETLKDNHELIICPHCSCYVVINKADTQATCKICGKAIDVTEVISNEENKTKEKMKIAGGLLVILEGGEGAGKTTQAKALMDYYNSKGYNTKYFREPGGNKLAEDIRNMILYNEMDTVTETLLMNAARKINIDTNILPALRDGCIVILDRFTKSTLVYQGILNNGDLDFINECITEVTKDLLDDSYGYSIEFTLLCDPEVAVLRAAEDGHERNKYDEMAIDKYKKVNDAYCNLYRSNKLREYYFPITCMIDTTTLSLDDVFNRLVAGVDKLLESCDIIQELD